MPDNRRIRGLVTRINKGEQITASWLNSLVAAINDNTTSVASPIQKMAITPAGPQDGNPTTGGGGSPIGDETFKAYADDITSTSTEFTDDAGDKVTVDVIDKIEFIEENTGRKLTLEMDYDTNRPV